MISLFVIVATLLSTNLYALSRSRRLSRIPFAVAVAALVVAVLGPFAGVLRLPLPSSFLLLWLLFIPIAAICAVAATLLGVLGLAAEAFAAVSPAGRQPAPRHRCRRWILTAIPAALILAAAVSNLVTPLRLLDASVQGVETSAGTVVGDTRYGASFTAAVSGRVAGNLTASVNYRPAYPRPVFTHSVTGGSWSFAAYQHGQYRGTLYGSVGPGTLHWNVDVTQGDIQVDFVVVGGTGAYLGARGHLRFSGSLLHTTFPPTVAGNLQTDLS